MNLPGEIDSAYYYRRQQGGGIIDRSTAAVRNCEYADLPFTDEQLYNMTKEWSEPVLAHIPRFRYWDAETLGDKRKMAHPENFTGHQQRAFEFYWSTLMCIAKGQIGLGVGVASCAGPGILGTDKYAGKDAPPSPDGRYGNWYEHTHMLMDAERTFPFFDGKFGGVFSNHVIEHLHDTERFIWECLRVVRIGGVVCIVQPDMAHMARGTADPTHVQERSADEFLGLLRRLIDIDRPDNDYDRPKFEVLDHNTFDNMYSFNTVLRRTSHPNLDDRYGRGT